MFENEKVTLKEQKIIFTFFPIIDKSTFVFCLCHQEFCIVVLLFPNFSNVTAITRVIGELGVGAAAGRGVPDV